MKLEKFKEKNKKKQGIILFTIVCVLLITGVFLYKTFASFQVIENEDLIHGSIEDPGDVYFAFYVDGVLSKTMPSKESNYVFNSKKSYCGELGKKDDNIIPWYHREDGSITVEGILTTHTKCVLYFERGENFIEKIKEVPIKEEESNEEGLYKVSHEDAEITYTEEKEKQDLLKQEELRYAGSDPDNYVWFNHELWRVIGLVNTPEGQRIKLIRKDSIGRYTWDSSEITENKGYGINEWSTSDVNQVLNDYYSQNKINQTCYQFDKSENDQYIYKKVSCSFDGKNGNKVRGLKQVDEMIDTVTWNLGAGIGANINTDTTSSYYNQERSNNTGKNCTANCLDNIVRTTSWKGKIALMYPSDYGYASSGGKNKTRMSCLSLSMKAWKDVGSEECLNNNWIGELSDSTIYLLTPIQYQSSSAAMVTELWQHAFTDIRGANSGHIFPTLYLKTDILVSQNSTGTIENPYII